MTDTTASGALDAADSFLARFVSWPSPEARWAAVLFAAHTHCTDMGRVLVFASTPRMAFVSDQPASGKTFAMARVASLCARPVICTDPTAPALAKIIGESHSCVAIDEIDLLLRKGTSKQEVRTILNAGYSRSGTVLRANGQVPVFGPLMLAGLDVGFTTSALLRPTYTRSVTIRMAAAAGGSVEAYRERLHDAAAASVAGALDAWARQHLGEIADCWPEMPDGADNRLGDIWEPLVICGDIAQGDWPARARAAFAALGLGSESSAPAVAPEMRIVGDLAAVWDADEPALPSSVLIGRLVDLKGAPYRSLWRQPELAGSELAALLAPHGVEPARLPRDGGPQVRGYQREQFAALWATETATADMAETAPTAD